MTLQNSLSETNRTGEVHLDFIFQVAVLAAAAGGEEQNQYRVVAAVAGISEVGSVRFAEKQTRRLTNGNGF